MSKRPFEPEVIDKGDAESEASVVKSEEVLKTAPQVAAEKLEPSAVKRTHVDPVTPPKLDPSAVQSTHVAAASPIVEEKQREPCAAVERTHADSAISPAVITEKTEPCAAVKRTRVNSANPPTASPPAIEQKFDPTAAKRTHVDPVVVVAASPPAIEQKFDPTAAKRTHVDSATDEKLEPSAVEITHVDSATDEKLEPSAVEITHIDPATDEKLDSGAVAPPTHIDPATDEKLDPGAFVPPTHIDPVVDEKLDPGAVAPPTHIDPVVDEKLDSGAVAPPTHIDPATDEKLDPGAAVEIPHVDSALPATREELDPCVSVRPTPAVDALTVPPPASALSSENVSRVVHISAIPHSVTDQRIALMGLSFGDVACILFLKNKGQAFVDFADIGDAGRMVVFFQRHAALVDGNRLHIQFSNHKQLSLSQMSRSVARTQIALKFAKVLKAAAAAGARNSVLRLLLHDLVTGASATVTLDILYQVFSKWGQVLKIVLGRRSASSLLAFVQMMDCVAAAAAVREMNNQCLFGGGFSQCSVEVARSPFLVVRQNSARARDYTNPCLAAAAEGEQMTTTTSSMMTTTNVDMSDDVVEYMPDEQETAAVAAAPTAPLPPPPPPDDDDDDQTGVGGCVHPDDDHAAAAAMMMYAAASRTATAAAMMSPMNPFGIRSALAAAAALFDTPELVPAAAFAQNNNNNTNTPPQQPQQPQPYQPRTQRRVLIVSNLNPEKVNPDNLFILFGVYGDVKRVRILFNKKDTALIQFNSAEQADTALKNLDGVSIFGKKLKVSFSKHLNVQRVKEGVDVPELTKDFEESSLHRFKKPGSKNYMNIYPPNTSLHLSNISDDVDEQQIKSMFSDFGTVLKFRFFEHDKHMAAVTMDSVENACHALMGCHNHVMPKGRFLRVSFSRPR